MITGKGIAEVIIARHGGKIAMKTKMLFTLLLVISLTMALVACSPNDENEAAADENEYDSETVQQQGELGELAQTGELIVADEPYEPEPEPEPPPRRWYIALGDSVSAGYGIHSPAYRHSDIFFDLLYQSGFANEYFNMAVDGLTTTALLSRLNNMPPDYLEKFQNAAVITLNIGGNNILRPFLEHLPDADEFTDLFAEAMDFIEETRELIAEFMAFIEESQDTIAEVLDFASDIMGVVNNFSIGDIMRLREFINRASVLDDAAVVFDGFTALEAEAVDIFTRASDMEILSALSLLTGNFPPQLETALQNGVQTFASDFTEIITWLEYNAPGALIIVNTVYNPIPQNIPGISLEISNRSQRLVRQINQNIHRQSAGGAFVVSDIYSILSDELELMNFNLDFVHPNPAGHNLVAQKNFVDFLRNVGD
jgi:lysophospholipase L1-like esterase